MAPELLIGAIIEDVAKSKDKIDRKQSDSLTPSILKHDFYSEAKREYQQQDQLKTLRRIARDLEE